MEGFLLLQSLGSKMTFLASRVTKKYYRLTCLFDFAYMLLVSHQQPVINTSMYRVLDNFPPPSTLSSRNWVGVERVLVRHKLLSLIDPSVVGVIFDCNE
jgi:hypothetical protein